MRLEDIYTFKQSSLGTHMVSSISRALKPWLPTDIDVTQVMGIGCTGVYMPDTAYIHVMPPVYYDTFHYIDMFNTANTVVADEDHLPFRNTSMHTAVLIHALEHADSPWAMIAEINRLMVSGGRVIVVVPNRVSLWSRVSKAPFSHGQPYTKKQLEQLMHSAGFVAITHAYALFFPPVQVPFQSKVVRFCNRMGNTFWRESGGVIIGVYEKQIVRRVKQKSQQPKLSALGATILPQPAPEPEITPKIKNYLRASQMPTPINKPPDTQSTIF